jgi:hypothetical protein
MKSGSSNVSSVDLAGIRSLDGLKIGVLAHSRDHATVAFQRLFVQSQKYGILGSLVLA